jgi:hypothetical protein
MIVDPDQEYRNQYKEGWSHPSGSACFGTKVVSSFNGVDPSFMISVADPVSKAKWLKYLT